MNVQTSSTRWSGLSLALAALVVSAAFSGCGGGTDKPLGPADTEEFRACSSDDDCVYTTNGCCDCANGGEDIAVAKSMFDEFRSEFECSGECTLRAADPPCGSGTVHCQSSLCVYTKKAP